MFSHLLGHFITICARLCFCLFLLAYVVFFSGLFSEILLFSLSNLRFVSVVGWESVCVWMRVCVFL